MDAGRFPEAILRYRREGKRSIGRPMERRRENRGPQQASRPKTCQELEYKEEEEEEEEEV
jgi:hypothetical protein